LLQLKTKKKRTEEWRFKSQEGEWGEGRWEDSKGERREGYTWTSEEEEVMKR
jgi:hypothetical protein